MIDINNYWAISITPIISRIIEKTVSDELFNYLLAKDLSMILSMDLLEIDLV